MKKSLLITLLLTVSIAVNAQTQQVNSLFVRKIVGTDTTYTMWMGAFGTTPMYNKFKIDAMLADIISGAGVNLNGKVDKVTGSSLITDAEKAKLSSVQTGATANSTDEQLRDRATHTGVQPINTVTNLQLALDNKANLLNPTFTGLVILPKTQIGTTTSVTNTKTNVYYGDSETLGITGPTSIYFRWSSIVARQTGYNELNMGIGGTLLVAQNANDSSGFNRRNNTPIFNATTSGYHFVMYGVNDAGISTTILNYTNALDAYILAQLSRGWPANRIVLCTPFPVQNHSAAQILLMQGYATAMLNKSVQYGTRYVDCTNTILTYPTDYKKSFYTVDATHPNNQGNALIAEFVKKAILESDVLALQITNNGFTYAKRNLTITQDVDSVLLNINDEAGRHIFSVENYFKNKAKVSFGLSKNNFINENNLSLGRDLLQNGVDFNQIHLGSSFNGTFNQQAKAKIVLANIGSEIYGFGMSYGGMEVWVGNGISLPFTVHSPFRVDKDIRSLSAKFIDSISVSPVSGIGNTGGKITLFQNSPTPHPRTTTQIGLSDGAGLTLTANGSVGGPVGVLIGSGMDARTITRNTAAIWSRPSNDVTINRSLHVKGELLLNTDSLGQGVASANLITFYKQAGTFTGIGLSNAGSGAAVTIIGQNTIGTPNGQGIVFGTGFQSSTITTSNAAMHLNNLNNVIVNRELTVRNKQNGLLTDSILVAGSGGVVQRVASFNIQYNNRVLSGTTTLDFPLTQGQITSELTFTVTGVVEGDNVVINRVNNALYMNGEIITAMGSGVNTVTARYTNTSTSSKDPSNASFKFTVFK